MGPRPQDLCQVEGTASHLVPSRPYDLHGRHDRRILASVLHIRSYLSFLLVHGDAGTVIVHRICRNQVLNLILLFAAAVVV